MNCFNVKNNYFKMLWSGPHSDLFEELQFFCLKSQNWVDMRDILIIPEFVKTNEFECVNFI